MPAFLDLPERDIADLSVTITGWVAGNDPQSQIRLHANGQPVAVRRYDRPDLKLLLPHLQVVAGIVAELNLQNLPPCESLVLDLHYGSEIVTKHCTLAPAIPGLLRTETILAAASRAFCESRLRCPACGGGADNLTHGEGFIECNHCADRYQQNTRALNMISGGLKLSSNLAESENVSSNPYPPHALALIAQTTAAGGWVLDCGAGSRKTRMRNVVNVEIVDYASTDVLAVGESLPFADDSFDAVLSMAVLEHVREPFRCAKELARVLKPGGTLIADVPFLQPLHGYPHHYYNMTEQGLRGLFAETLLIESCEVPLHGHPVHGLAWILSQYRLGLPPSLRDQFDRMTFGDLAATDLVAFLAAPLATQLSADAQRIIACLNTIRAQKPARN
jgi:SAM-dependent methyltransferase